MADLPLREIAKRGHEVRLMSPRFVRPYVKSNKNVRATLDPFRDQRLRVHRATSNASKLQRWPVKLEAISPTEKRAPNAAHSVRRIAVDQNYFFDRM
jgi:hypothetical protein